jgi:hypothetical protein
MAVRQDSALRPLTDICFSGSLPTILLRLLRCSRGNFATIPNYLGRELRYMDAGE